MNGLKRSSTTGRSFAQVHRSHQFSPPRRSDSAWQHPLIKGDSRPYRSTQRALPAIDQRKGNAWPRRPRYRRHWLNIPRHGMAAAVSIGIGGMVGAGIFSILGLVAQAAGNAMWIAFAIGGVPRRFVRDVLSTTETTTARTTPPIANAIHMALPAACATTPRIEKMPAPTMPPMPIDTAAAMAPMAPDVEPVPAVTGGTARPCIALSLVNCTSVARVACSGMASCPP